MRGLRITLIIVIVAAVGALGWVAVDSRSRLSRAEKRLHSIEADVSGKAESTALDDKADASDLEELRGHVDDVVEALDAVASCVDELTAGGPC
jgi:hypothetical protein